MATAKDKRTKARKTKKRKYDSVGVAHIKSSFNNTIITLTDLQGNVITWSSGGHQGRYKGSRKSTAFAAQLAARFCAQEAIQGGMKKVECWIKGPGSGREAAVRSLKAEGLDVIRIKDCTSIPHNGCRPTKRRRM
ncbi:MAG TPA: 30S ribosomal protein S11 [Candidatus Krumholzibacteria bacterium]|nr:30S ribosomal protein S11 [Candidatus Krumholzibacteria bacterium]HPD72079.1 30S ribosomal protein S11 [Candidatus Krumholzibacteria bacterium]HRY40989.1 30S ribosomal protein S11 [Candidatus Krumholzibacteria bacterium]